ncbi:MAG: DsbA family oxidoreductase [Alphaproteobacteria bacterium]|nr:MAG: DsbA family oxidoreductase [Alphaproteobacteria bacterium]|tara:strand:- start:1179 stop:1817 length:639 start_codon:yes stop_codon:yes gene_type:complete
MIKIDIVSDTVCPWCYIGKKRLDKAIEDYKGQEFEINWHAFQLNPNMPIEGINRELYLSTKFGGKERADSIYEQIKQAGSSSNISFNFNEMFIMPNSFYSHMLIELSKEQNLQNEIAESLFDAFFIKGKNIGNLSELTNIAISNNIKDFNEDLFKNRKDLRNIIQTSDENSRSKGVSGVPFFIINNNYAISGAQESEVFKKIFETCLLENAI